MKPYFFIAAALVSLSAHANSFVANGGYGYKMDDGSIAMLDLVEAGLEKNPYFEKNVVIQPDIAKWVNQALTDPAFPNDLVIQKLSEIYAVSPLSALITAKAMTLYDWILVNPELQNPNDLDTPIDNSRVVLVAARLDRAILFNRGNASKMNGPNFSSLILHEIFYAQVTPSTLGDGSKDQNSRAAKKLNSYVFSSRLKKLGIDGLVSVGREINAAKLSKSGIVIVTRDGKINAYPTVNGLDRDAKSISLDLNGDSAETQARNSILSFDFLCKSSQAYLRSYFTQFDVQLGTYNSKNGNREYAELLDLDSYGQGRKTPTNTYWTMDSDSRINCLEKLKPNLLITFEKLIEGFYK